MMETYRCGVDENGEACFYSAEAWWKAQQVLWENRQFVRRLSENDEKRI